MDQLIVFSVLLVSSVHAWELWAKAEESFVKLDHYGFKEINKHVLDSWLPCFEQSK